MYKPAPVDKPEETIYSAKQIEEFRKYRAAFEAELGPAHDQHNREKLWSTWWNAATERGVQLIHDIRNSPCVMIVDGAYSTFLGFKQHTPEAAVAKMKKGLKP